MRLFWFRYGERCPSPEEIKYRAILERHLQWRYRDYIAYWRCWLPDSFAVDGHCRLGAGSHWQIPLIGGICCAAFYALVDRNATSCIAYHGKWLACCVGNTLKLSGRQWSGWDVWICCLAAMLLMDLLPFLAKFMALCRCGRGIVFGISGFPVLIRQLPPVCVQLFPHPSATGNHASCLCPCNVVIFHGISLTSFIANLLAIPLTCLSRFR